MTEARSPLVIIDMQSEFLSSLDQDHHDLLVTEVAAVTEKARAKNRPVILVEYQYSGPTIKLIKNKLRGYSNVKRVIKRSNDGSKELSELFQKSNSDYRSLTVCGVNLSYCVLETVSGLIARGYKCRVIKEATANCCDSELERLDDSYCTTYFRNNLVTSAVSELTRLNLAKMPKAKLHKRLVIVERRRA